MTGIIADASRVTPSEFLGFLRAPREATLEDHVGALFAAVMADDKEAADQARARIAGWKAAREIPLVEVEQLETRNGRHRRMA